LLGKFLALRMVLVFTAPDAGISVAAPSTDLLLIVVRGASPLSTATRPCSGHSILSGGISLSVVISKLKRNSY
jgi:hypothetical protein